MPDDKLSFEQNVVIPLIHHCGTDLSGELREESCQTKVSQQLVNPPLQ